MTACVLSAILGMASVYWYMMSGEDEKEVEASARAGGKEGAEEEGGWKWSIWI